MKDVTARRRLKPRHDQALPESRQPRWWKEAVVYQIYARSFRDSNGDGVGDLRGIIDKLDYITDLGIDAVWLNPIYPSPNADMGYDITDHCAIHTEYGTMADFDELLEKLHERGIRVIMDIVANHSSDEHEWFIESRSSRDNPYRDYYHWWPAESGEPNFRYSIFGEDDSAWAYDESTDAYYLHYFSKHQPDLKWENPAVRQEIYSILRFWADKGVDGFRLDAFHFVAKDTNFPTLPAGFEKSFTEILRHYSMGPSLHDYLREMRDEVFRHYDLVTVAEGAGTSFEDAHALVDADRDELDIAYHFDAVSSSLDDIDGPFHKLRNVFSRWDAEFAEKGWLSIFLANHDVPRMVSTFADDSDNFRVPSSKLLNTLVLSLRGTPFCYYGDEIGMTNANFQSIGEYRDVAAVNGYRKAARRGENMDEYLSMLQHMSRDNARTPMQWDDSDFAGFSQSKPWLTVNNNYERLNVAEQDADPRSVLAHFRELTRLRQQHLALVYGEFCLWCPEHEQVFAYTRTLGADQLLVLLNFSPRPAVVDIATHERQPSVLINNYPTLTVNIDSIRLKPYQAVILRTASTP